jgi:hypothetical protein
MEREQCVVDLSSMRPTWDAECVTIEASAALALGVIAASRGVAERPRRSTAIAGRVTAVES